MPKAEAGSVKDIAKRIKSKGLQKLKFFCQMCQKQCRDANGFQCHLSSDSHLRQMKIFSENATGFMDQFSREFEQLFLETLRRRHGTALVNANNVYQQVIQDKVHVHMNATQWTTLTDFCKYLGKTGKCKVEQNERGWFVRFIERDASKMARQEALEKRLAAEQSAEDELHTRIQQQRLAAAQANAEQQLAPTNLADDATTSTTAAAMSVSLSLQKSLLVGAATTKSHKKTKNSNKAAVASLLDDGDDDDDQDDVVTEKVPAFDVPALAAHAAADTGKTTTAASSKMTTTILDNGSSKDNNRKRPPSGENDVQQQEKGRSGESKKARHAKDDSHGNNNNNKDSSAAAASAAVPWLYRDIVVRIINKDLQHGRYFKRKAVVDRVLDRDTDKNNNKDNTDDHDDNGPSFAAELTILPNDKNASGGDNDDSDRVVGDIVRLDQDDLETVIPKASDLLVDDNHDDNDDDNKKQKKRKKKHKKKNRVCIVRGKYAGKKAKVLQLDKSRQEARLELKDGTILKHVDYEDFSKVM